jgi:hypothetical protein
MMGRDLTGTTTGNLTTSWQAMKSRDCCQSGFRLWLQSEFFAFAGNVVD